MVSRKDGQTGYPSIDRPWLKYYDKDAIESELSSMCMYQYLFDANQGHLRQTALSYFGRSIPYGEVFDHIREAAAAFGALGIRKGDVVSFCTVTVPEVIYAFYALNMIGAVGNMMDPRTNAEGIETYLRESDSHYVILLDALLPRFRGITDGEAVRKVVVLSPADSMPGPMRLGYRIARRVALPGDKYISWNRAMRLGAGSPVEPRAYEKDLPVSIMHTGGTTGNPKGVLFSDDSYNCLNDQFKHYNMQPRRGDVALNVMPPFIAYGMAVGIHTFLCFGCKVVLIPLLDPGKLDKLIAKYKPQLFWGVPTHLDSLRTSPRMRKMDLSFLKTAGVGGDAIKTDSEITIGEFLREHGCKYGVTKGYGMTEVNSAVCACGEGYNPIGSVGIPLVHVVIAAFAPGTETELPYGEQGEICIQTPSRMLGYLGREEETQRVMRVHSDGQLWIHSGDLGYVTQNGFVFIVDRLKRMIIREDGFKVYPSVVENVICACDGVTDCAVIGVRSQRYSQGVRPKAFVTIAKEEQAESMVGRVRRQCEEKLAEYQIPVEIEIVDALPLTKVGKIDYRKLESMSPEDA